MPSGIPSGLRYHRAFRRCNHYSCQSVILRQDAPYIERNSQEFGAVRVIQQDDQFPVPGNSLDQRLKSKNRSSMHGDGFSRVGRIGFRYQDAPSVSIILQVGGKEKIAEMGWEQALGVECLIP